MKIVISAQGQNLDAETSPVFGRCPTLIFVDSESLEFEALANPALAASGGAGIQAAQFAVNQGAEAVITGNLGPNAFDVLEAAGVPGYLTPGGTVRQAVNAFQAGELTPMQGASAVAHAGMKGPQPSAAPARSAEMAALRETLKSLRQQLAETLTEIEKLEKEAEED